MLLRSAQDHGADACMWMSSVLRLSTRPIVWMLLCCALLMQSAALWSALQAPTVQQHCHVTSDTAQPPAPHEMNVTHHCLMWCMGTAALAPIRFALPILITMDRHAFQPFRPIWQAWQTAPPLRPPIAS